jgi:hypothetical protein
MQAIYTPEMREGDFFDYFLRVRPYSMKRGRSVDEGARKMMEFISSALPAIAQTAHGVRPWLQCRGRDSRRR